jgi:hypothetical protein
MDDKCRKVVPPGTPCGFGSTLPGAEPDQGSCAPVMGKVGEAGSARLVFGSHCSGVIADASADQDGLEFGAARNLSGYGPRFDVPGPMMRTVRDPSLSLIALSGVDPEGPVMVQIPPVADAGSMRNNPSLAGIRIGFASEYVSGDVREVVEHSAHFAQVLGTLRAGGAQLMPVHALLVDDTRYFTLDSNNEINDRITENRLDVLVSDAQSAAFHNAAATGNPRICVSTGTDAAGVSMDVWFYGAYWASDRLEALVQSCQQVLLQEKRLAGIQG